MDTSDENLNKNTMSHKITDKTPITIEIPNHNDDPISQNINNEIISDSQNHQTIFKRPAPEPPSPSSPLSTNPPTNSETHSSPITQNKTIQKIISKKP